MKIYTEVNYEWKDGSLVQTSSKSFDYCGDVTLCAKGGGGKKILDDVGSAVGSVGQEAAGSVTGLTELTDPLTTKVNETVSNVAGGLSDKLAENTASITSAGEKLGDTMADGTTMLTKGLDSAGNVIGEGSAFLKRQGDKLAQLGKEAIDGKGGYADDAGPGPAGPGPTGSEDATAGRTLLTGIRKKGSGRSAHVSSGTASSVS